jgi:hypothetical protein
MKPWTRRGPEIGENILESCDVQNFDNQGEAVVGAHMKENRNMTNNRWTIPTRIGSMLYDFQLPPYEFNLATRQARDIAISANSIGTWFFSKEQLPGNTQHLFEVISYITELRGIGCLRVVKSYLGEAYILLSILAGLDLMDSNIERTAGYNVWTSWQKLPSYWQTPLSIFVRKQLFFFSFQIEIC